MKNTFFRKCIKKKKKNLLSFVVKIEVEQIDKNKKFRYWLFSSQPVIISSANKNGFLISVSLFTNQD